MERWVPLFNIFLHSPFPEAEASVWFQQNQRQDHRQPTSVFLSLLLTPTDVVSRRSPSSPPIIRRRMWLQTLPYATQSRVLSFLKVESRRFCERLLFSIATKIIDSVKEDGDATPMGEGSFWVVSAACHLLDEISVRVRRGEVVEQGRSGEEDGDEEDGAEFGSLPRWLKDTAAASRPLLPWLPLSSGELRRRTHTVPTVPSNDGPEDIVVPMDEENVEQSDVHVDHLILSPQMLERAEILKAKLHSLDTPSGAVHVSQDIQKICVDVGRNLVPDILGLIEPWKTDDETMIILLSNLLDNSESKYSDWPSHVFSAVILPRLLSLQCASSRVLLSSIVDFCNTHQKDVKRVLLFPLIYRKEGINSPVCDVLVMVMKECMHPSQISAFCQRLLCAKRANEDFICLPCHRNMVSDELEWTESLFSMFQHILSWNAPLTPDTIDNLISVLEDVTCKFSKSLKFGRFLLCLVTKSDHALKFHRLSLTRVAEKTDTFVTKSVVSKLIP